MNASAWSSARIWLALCLALNVFWLLPFSAIAQGETTRCPDAPLRFPSGNWVWFAYIPGTHNGIDLVDKNREAPNPPPYVYPENTIPVYAPISGNLSVAGWYFGQPGSVLLTTTLDPVFEGKVPTRNLELWMTHMSNHDGSVLYIVHPSGPIHHGELIGYQGRGNTNPVHVHTSTFDSNTGHVQDPTTYVNALVSSVYGSPNAYFAIACNEKVVATIESPAFFAGLHDSADISGYALDPANAGSVGIDELQLYRDGYSGSSGILLGAASYGLPRADIAAKYGSRFLNSGYTFNWSLACLPLGYHDLYLYAHQTSTGKWRLMDVHGINILSAPPCFFNFLPSIFR